ncbi:tetratricopeptide repeat-containing sensor histidine kinase [Aquimarina litoralis]|uniref:tetratricopeptide repeat-containing sensor histidine kinase n=1 Tax=Aquimarina litoralis TaxID=584605 RepID=UPI001C58781E|nr:histidine kinase [Aquimarina litoralis]MBW1298857.1 tetratricopeptide repeat protein [Aquimarina litoralis]
MFRKNGILILIFLISLFSFSQQREVIQTKIDSFEISPNTIEKQEEYRKLLESKPNLSGWIYYYRKKGHYYLSRSQNDSVLYYTGKAIERYHELVEVPSLQERQMKDIYLYQGIVLTNTRKYRQSTDALFKAIDISKKYPKRHQGSNPYIYSYLASNYIKMGDKKKALAFRLQIAKDTVFMAIPREAGATYNRIGLLYFDRGEKDSAVYYYRKALNTYVESDNNAGIKSMYANIGRCFKEQNQIDSTLYFYKKSKKLHEKYPDENYGYGKLFIEANNAFISIKDGKSKEALVTLGKVMDSINKITKIDDEVVGLHDDTSDYLIEAYRNLNQNEKAIEMASTKDAFFRKYHQQVLDERLRELNIAYEVKEKDESIEQLETVTEEQQTIIKQRTFITMALLGLLLLIVGVGILLFRQRKLKSKYETTHLKQRLLRSQLNPHFVFNALNTVSNLVHKKSDNTLTYIAKLSSLIRLILKNSREEFVALEDELQSVEDYLELQSNFSQKFTYTIEVEDIINLEETFIPPMFIQPFIENSILHGLNGIENGFIKIDITIDREEELLKCYIQDNGIGITKSSEMKAKANQEHQSFSGKIIKERLQIYAKSLNKKTTYVINEMSEGTGTEVKVVLPYELEV